MSDPIDSQQSSQAPEFRDLKVQFGEFEFDSRNHRLLKNGAPVKLRPKHFKVLQCLLLHKNEPTPNGVILEFAWNDVSVDPQVLTTAIYELRKNTALGPDAIETVPTIGYRFCLTISESRPIEAIEPAPASTAEPSSGRRVHLRRPSAWTWLAIAAVVVVGIPALYLIGTPDEINTAFNETLVRKQPWINYEPVSLSEATDETIRADLSKIQALGFRGVVTFGRTGALTHTPELAHALGLSVIMGIRDPGNAEELNAAVVQAPYVDAYCVGHNWLHTEGEAILFSAINELRRRTGRAVSTTVFLKDYDKVASKVDWLFADIELKFPSEGMDPEQMVLDVDNGFNKANELVAKYGKPLLLKMIHFPSGGGKGYTEQSQLLFYKKLGEKYFLRPQLSLAPFLAVSFSFHSAFDLPWKLDEGLPAHEVHVGLLRPDGSPKPAACELASFLPYLEPGDPAKRGRYVTLCR